ncbi:MAG TPA: hypothetical protein VNO14_04895, partial [Blastocatellia bacterium]|nr:hypothetical protein [Blastocatellia bacterium]
MQTNERSYIEKVEAGIPGFDFIADGGLPHDLESAGTSPAYWLAIPSTLRPPRWSGSATSSGSGGI